MSRKKRRRSMAKTTGDTRVFVDTPIDRPRLHARFGSLKGRAVEMNITPLGPVVDATSPAEMTEQTDALIVEQTRKLEPN